MHTIKLFFIFSILLCNSAFAAGQKVEIKTNLGNILLEIYPEKAPKTVNNFLTTLFEHSNQRWPNHLHAEVGKQSEGDALAKYCCV